MKHWIVRRTLTEIIYVEAETKEQAIKDSYNYSVSDIELIKTTAKRDLLYEKELNTTDK